MGGPDRPRVFLDVDIDGHREKLALCQDFVAATNLRYVRYSSFLILL